MNDSASKRVQRSRLVPISRRQFGAILGALGFHYAFGAWYTIGRDGEVPTYERVLQKALGMRDADAATPAKYNWRFGIAYQTKKINEVVRYGVWEFAEDLEKRTGGEIRIQLIGANAICTELDCVQKAMGGTIDLYSSSSQNAAPTIPYHNVLDYAFLFPSRASMHYFLYHPKSNKLFRDVIREKYGLVWLFSLCETRNIYAGLKYKDSPPITKPEQLRGAKLRITGSQMGRIALTQFGTNPIPFAWEETLEGLKSGALDGAETWSSAAAAVGMGKVLSQDVFLEFFTGFGHHAIRREVLEKLPPKLQEAVMESAYFGQQWTQKAHEKALVEVTGIDSPPRAGSIWHKESVKVVRLTPKEKEAWVQMASPQHNPKAWEEWRDKLTKIAGFDAYPELYKLAREIPADLPATEVKPRRWWKEA